jgi:hypothetical protein
MHPDKLKNILNLSPQDRYGYFIRKVADTEEVWMIKESEEYVTLGDNDEQVTIPVFPEKEFAELLLTDDWSNCTVETLDVRQFMEWLDKLQQEKVKIAAFPTEDFNAVVVKPDEMKNHLLYELQQYE